MFKHGMWNVKNVWVSIRNFLKFTSSNSQTFPLSRTSSCSEGFSLSRMTDYEELTASTPISLVNFSSPKTSPIVSHEKVCGEFRITLESSPLCIQNGLTMESLLSSTAFNKHHIEWKERMERIKVRHAEKIIFSTTILHDNPGYETRFPRSLLSFFLFSLETLVYDGTLALNNS